MVRFSDPEPAVVDMMWPQVLGSPSTTRPSNVFRFSGDRRKGRGRAGQVRGRAGQGRGRKGQNSTDGNAKATVKGEIF